LVNTLFGCEDETFYSRIDNDRFNFTLDTPEHFRSEKETSIFPQEKRREKDNNVSGNSIIRMDRREAS
jgi:hypothetical protein